MTQKRIIAALSMLILMSVLNACEKYEDGGVKRKAEKNILGTWNLQNYFLNDVDQTATLIISNYTETYSEGGDYSRSYVDQSADPKNATGNWSLTGDQSLLNISGLGSFQLSNATETVSASEYTILKLTKDDLWYSFINGGNTHEFHLVHN